MLEHSRNLQRKKDEAIQAEYLTEELASFYDELFACQEKNILAEGKYDFSSFTDASELPALKTASLSFTGDLEAEAKSILFDILDVIEKHHSGIDTSPVRRAAEEDMTSLTRHAVLLLEHDVDGLNEGATSMKTGLDEYIFILVNWLKPLLASIRPSAMEKVDTEEWLAPVCPFCGYLADMGKIVESKDNLRLLHCGLCEHEWKFPRLTCAICENTDKETLGYLNTADESPYRVDYCDACKGYIKTVRVPKLQEESRFDLTVENVVTTWLDASAMAQGYNRP